jgi:long-chain acyl-CoA synthetase
MRKASKVKTGELHPNDSLELDLGLDSMERVELLVALEDALGAEVPDSVASEVYTVREMIEAVRAGVGGAAGRPKFQGWAAILGDASGDAEFAAFFKPLHFWSALWFVMSRFGALVARVFFRLRVEGIEKLPKSGPYIICPNHQSFMDPPLVVGILPYPIYKRLFSVGTSEIFGSKLAGMLARSFRLYPVDPDANLVPAMRVGAAGLRRGDVLLLYPEGERSIDGVPKAFKRGAAILATHLKVPIYPMAMDGFYEAWPRGKKFIQRLAPLRVRVGDPVMPPEHANSLDEAYARLTAEVRARVVEMWNELHGTASAAAAD